MNGVVVGGGKRGRDGREGRGRVERTGDEVVVGYAVAGEAADLVGATHAELAGRRAQVGDEGPWFCGTRRMEVSPFGVREWDWGWRGGMGGCEGYQCWWRERKERVDGKTMFVLT